MHFQGEKDMANKENYRVAIDIFCCHLGMSFDEACAELGLTYEHLQNQHTDCTNSSIEFLTDNKK